MLRKFRILFLTCGLLSVFACTDNSHLARDPKNRLEEYISKSFAVSNVDDRTQLLTYLTGVAKSRLASWSDDQFRQAFIESKRQFVKLLIREVKARSQSSIDITYELTYLDQSKGTDAKVTNRKLCEMTLEDGRWLIADVRNIKELVEYKNEMSLP